MSNASYMSLSNFTLKKKKTNRKKREFSGYERVCYNMFQHFHFLSSRKSILSKPCDLLIDIFRNLDIFVSHRGEQFPFSCFAKNKNEIFYALHISQTFTSIFPSLFFIHYVNCFLVFIMLIITSNAF